jgi:hypothetical protein
MHSWKSQIPNMNEGIEAREEQNGKCLAEETRCTMWSLWPYCRHIVADFIMNKFYMLLSCDAYLLFLIKTNQSHHGIQLLSGWCHCWIVQPRHPTASPALHKDLIKIILCIIKRKSLQVYAVAGGNREFSQSSTNEYFNMLLSCKCKHKFLHEYITFFKHGPADPSQQCKRASNNIQDPPPCWILMIFKLKFGGGNLFSPAMTSTIEGNNSVGSLLEPLLKKVTPVVGSRMLCTMYHIIYLQTSL